MVEVSKHENVETLDDEMTKKILDYGDTLAGLAESIITKLEDAFPIRRTTSV
jgi:hypothetical protein